MTEEARGQLHQAGSGSAAAEGSGGAAHLRLLALLPEGPHQQRAQQRPAQRRGCRGRRLVAGAGLRAEGWRRKRGGR
jgi:hypothetical protein